MPSLAIATWRLILAVLILTPVAWGQAGSALRHLQKRDVLIGGIAGFFLSLHFVFWFNSLTYTSVASSVALVCTDPLWVGIASVIILGERMRGGTAVGIVLALVGTTLIALSDSSSTNTTHAAPLLGDALALAGSWSCSVYFVIGRRMRQRVPLMAYIWLVYTSSAVVLLVWTLLVGQQMFGFSPMAYVWVLALAVGSQVLGHTVFNWALRYLSATFVTISIMGEPIGSAILAWFLFDEGFASLQLIGFVSLLIGISVAASHEQRKPPAATDTEATPAGMEPVRPVGETCIPCRAMSKSL